MTYDKIEYEIRELTEKDLLNGFFITLSNLSHVGKIKTNISHAKRVLGIIQKSETHKIFVAALEDGEIVGTITALVEQKFIHDGGKICHIEDVATREGYEGKGIGSELVKKAIDYAKKVKSYKIILSCNEENQKFYEKLGFRKYELSMRYDIALESPKKKS